MAHEHEVMLLAPDGPLHEAFVTLGVPHVPFPGFSQGPSAALAGVKQGIEQALDLGCQVIHVHAGIELLIGVRRALRRLRPKSVPAVVFTVHSYFGKFPHIDYFLAAKVGRRLADRVIAVSHADGRTLAKYARLGERLHVVHNGTRDPGAPDPAAARLVRGELKTLHGIDPDARIGIVVGRLAAQKGIDVLFHALARYRGVPLVVLIVGDGVLRDELRDQADRLGLLHPTHRAAARAIFLGARSDVATLLPAADLFILPSRMEGLSLALIEAHAAGLPCVATTVGGNAEVVEPGVTGTLVPPDDVAALTSALQDELGDMNRLRSQGEAARARFLEHFTAEKMVGQTLEVYAKAAGQVQV